MSRNNKVERYELKCQGGFCLLPPVRYHHRCKVIRSFHSARQLYQPKDNKRPRPSCLSGCGPDCTFYIRNALQSQIAGKLLLWPGL